MFFGFVLVIFFNYFFLLQFLVVNKNAIVAKARRGGHRPHQPPQLLLHAATGSGTLGNGTGRGQGTAEPAWCPLDA